MYSVLAVDLDDTLLREDKSISARTRAALQRWEASGRRVVLATGRPPRSMRRIPEELHHFPRICYNGVAICEAERFQYLDAIPARDAFRIVEALLARFPDGRIGLEAADVLFVNQPWERPDVRYTPDLLSVAARPAAKILLFPEHFECTVSRLGALPDSAKALLSPKYNLVQIMPRAASKAHALRYLIQGWGLSMEQVIAFGDDVNDVEMVYEAGIGVAMANAVPAVKCAADRITTSNEEDGVALVLEELLERTGR